MRHGGRHGLRIYNQDRHTLTFLYSFRQYMNIYSYISQLYFSDFGESVWYAQLQY